MFQMIGSVFKYSFLVLTILVLSHIIEIKGVSISNHVHQGMRSIASFSPSAEVTRMKDSVSGSLNSRVKSIEAIDHEVSPEGERDLKKVIQNSARQMR